MTDPLDPFDPFDGWRQTPTVWEAAGMALLIALLLLAAVLAC